MAITNHIANAWNMVKKAPILTLIICVEVTKIPFIAVIIGAEFTLTMIVRNAILTIEIYHSLTPTVNATIEDKPDETKLSGENTQQTDESCTYL